MTNTTMAMVIRPPRVGTPIPTTRTINTTIMGTMLMASPLMVLKAAMKEMATMTSRRSPLPLLCALRYLTFHAQWLLQCRG